MTTETLEKTIARLMSLTDEAIQHATRGESDNAIWTRNDLEAALRTELSAPAVQGKPQLCCGNPAQCLRPCTPRGEWLAGCWWAARQPAIVQPVQPKEATYDSLIDSVKMRFKMC